jgi:hypothetical protein
MSSRSVATLAMLTALVAALGFLLSGIPNIELMTLGTFVSGALLGAVRGAGVGAGAMAVYSAFNPYGMAPPPTFAMQVVGLGAIGAAGGLLAGKVLGRRVGSAVGVAAGGAAGFLLTLGYDVLTNLGTAWSTGMEVVPALVGGLAFGVWHMVWNAGLFAVAGPPLLIALRRRRARTI